MSYQRTTITRKTKKTSNKLILPQKNINEYRKMPQCTTARLFYDNKNISLDLSGEIAAIELQWEGYARFQNKCGKGWIPMIDKNHMLLFSMGKESVNLNILDYHGKIRINFCTICTWDLNMINANIVRNIIDGWSTNPNSFASYDEKWSNSDLDYTPITKFRGNLI